MCTVYALSSAHVKLFRKKWLIYSPQTSGAIYFTSKIIFSPLRSDICHRKKYFLNTFFPLWGTYFHFFSETHCGNKKKCVLYFIAFYVLKILWCMFSLFLWYRNKAEGAAVKFHCLETTSLDPILTFYWRTADQSWRRNQIKNWPSTVCFLFSDFEWNNFGGFSPNSGFKK